jgi:hypothetical protein
MEKPILTKRTLLNYYIVDTEGTTSIPCSATVKPEFAYQSSNPFFSVYLRAITQANLNKVTAILDETPMVYFYEVAKYFLTGVIYQTQIKEGYELPSKGERVIVTIEQTHMGQYIVKNIELIPRIMLSRISEEDMIPLLQTFKDYYNGNKSSNK